MEDLETLERQAYIAGDTDKADLLARIIELEAQIEELETRIDDTVTLESWEKNNGPADSYKQFFHDCFDRLDGHYPCPSITSDYDQSIIFDAISKGE